MCEACNNALHKPTGIDIEAEVARFRGNLLTLIRLHEVEDQLEARDKEFAASLYSNFLFYGGLSPKQWNYVPVLLSRVEGRETFDGNFAPILIMFRLAATTGNKGQGLQRPRIRLLSDEGTFVMLVFDMAKPDKIAVHRGGWAGNGRREFCGTIAGNTIYPHSPKTMTPDVVKVIKDLAVDPAGVAKAMAGKLNMCMFCGATLSDEESKEKGYGPVCAENFGLPWGAPRTVYTQSATDSMLDELEGM